MHLGDPSSLVMRGVIRRREKIVKAGIAFPRDVLMKLDEITRRLGIPNRSKAVVEAIMGYISEKAWVYENSMVVGALCVIYDDTKLATPSKLLDVRNMFSHTVNMILHLPLDNKKSMDIWIVEGSVAIVRKLVEALERVKGVYMVRTIISKKSS